MTFKMWSMSDTPKLTYLEWYFLEFNANVDRYLIIYILYYYIFALFYVILPIPKLLFTPTMQLWQIASYLICTSIIVHIKVADL